MTKNILIIEAVKHVDIAEKLYNAAKLELDKADVSYEKISVPSCFEICQTLKMALDTDMYDGYITLGCIVKDESFEAKYMIAETIKSINFLATSYGLPISYGIISAQNLEQALVEANNKGSLAAQTALKMLTIYEYFIEKYEDFEPGLVEV
ncbi:MAG: 6,7-dimethyl-8-ribityllumazine synthase [Alphaproteobacteria bacterium]